MVKTVAVAGGSGFVGKKVVEKLVQRGYLVKMLIHNKNVMVSGSVIKIKGDISNRKDLVKLIAGTDFFINLVAVIDLNFDDKDFFKINVEAVKKELEVIRNTEIKMVQVSTIMVFNGTLGKERNEVWSRREFKNSNLYVRSKLEADRLIGKSVKKIVTVYPCIVIDRNNWLKPPSSLRGVASFIWWKIGGGIPGGIMSLIGSKNRWQNIVELDDVAEGIVLAMEKGRLGEGYILGGINLKAEDYLYRVRKITGRYGWRIRIPEWPFWLIRRTSGIIRWPKVLSNLSYSIAIDMWFSSRKAEKELGYKPKWKLI